jgi:hypothetical protein
MLHVSVAFILCKLRQYRPDWRRYWFECTLLFFLCDLASELVIFK